MNVGQVNLDKRDGHSQQGIAQATLVWGEGRVDDDEIQPAPWPHGMRIDQPCSALIAGVPG